MQKPGRLSWPNRLPARMTKALCMLQPDGSTAAARTPYTRYGHPSVLASAVPSRPQPQCNPAAACLPPEEGVGSMRRSRVLYPAERHALAPSRVELVLRHVLRALLRLHNHPKHRSAVLSARAAWGGPACRAGCACDVCRAEGKDAERSAGGELPSVRSNGTRAPRRQRHAPDRCRAGATEGKAFAGPFVCLRVCLLDGSARLVRSFACWFARVGNGWSRRTSRWHHSRSSADAESETLARDFAAHTPCGAPTSRARCPGCECCEYGTCLCTLSTSKHHERSNGGRK